MQEESNSPQVGQNESKRTEIIITPLSRRPAAGFKMVLVAAAPNCLILRPSSPTLFLHGISSLIFLLVVVVFLSDPWLLLLPVAVVIIEFVRIFRALLGAWVRFDRNRGIVTLGRSFLSVNHPLVDIIAVQLLKERLWLGFYQLNLVLAHPAGRRLNLYAHWKPNLVGKTGQSIADFLSVPLLDQINAAKA